MHQAPTTEPRFHATASRMAVMPEPQRRLRPHLAGMAGANHQAIMDSRLSGADRLPQRFAAAQKNLGNQAVLRMLSHSKPVLQPKLVINRPGDAFEREANSVADAVMRMPDPAISSEASRSIETQGSPMLQRVCACGGGCKDCQDKAGELQRLDIGATTDRSIAPPIVHDVLHSPGRPLDAATRSFMEPRFGADFRSVRVHTDARAAESANAVNALAYTVGQDIVFAAGQHAQSTESGRRVLAHELTHVIQQGRATAQASSVGSVQRSEGTYRPSPPTMPSMVRQESLNSLQRAACPKAPTHLGDTPLPADQDCDESQVGIIGQRYSFCEDSDVLKDESAARLKALAPALQQAPQIDIHGYASPEGPKGREQAYNLALSCHRANSIASFLVGAGVLKTRIHTFKHGGTTEFGSTDKNRVAIIPNIALVSPGPLTNRFRVAAVSFLACAPCNPFTDDGAVITSPLSPPKTEPPSGSSFRMKHWIEIEVVSDDSIHIKSSKVVDSGQEAGISGYCGTKSAATVLSKTGAVGPTGGADPVHGESVEWESEMVTRVNANVPPTLPDAPCGPLGLNPQIPPISTRFRMQVFADAARESGFVSATTFPFHHLYEDGNVKTFSGIPVRPTINFNSWATSTGVSPLEAEVGFKALRVACCSGKGVPGCAVECVGGESKAPTGSFVNTGDMIRACFGAGAALALGSCPTPCTPMGTVCPVTDLPSNP